MECWEMAADSNKGTKWAYQTAGSYTMEATAIYVQQTQKLPHPPVPREYTITLDEDKIEHYEQAASLPNSTPPCT
jgi:hypothetical protein